MNDYSNETIILKFVANKNITLNGNRENFFF